jgi:hypothetical protein
MGGTKTIIPKWYVYLRLFMALGDSHMTKIAICFFVHLMVTHHFFRFFLWKLAVFGDNAIQILEEGSTTYVHVTPDFGPLCEPGSKVPLGYPGVGFHGFHETKQVPC